MSPLLEFVPADFTRPAAPVVAGWEAPGERAVGASDAWKDVMKRAALVPPTDATNPADGRIRYGERSHCALRASRVDAKTRFIHRHQLRRAA